MPQSYTCLHYHLIWSTKDRVPVLTTDLREQLFEYIGGTVRAEKGRLIAAGGMPDHVHLLASIHKEMSISEALRIIKASSSGWIHQSYPDLKSFAWQVGYGAFSVSYSNVEAVTQYIASQAEHHRVQSFQEEFLEFLRRHHIEFDERYVWT